MAFLSATGLRTHIWNNNLKSVLLLAGFPVLLTLIGYAVALVWIAIGGEGEYVARQAAKGVTVGEPTLLDSMAAAAQLLPRIALFGTVGAGLWFGIAWLFHQSMINAATGARSVTRKQEPDLYNLLENLCISRGMAIPKLAVIESGVLNAYASGLSEKNYQIAVTRGLIERLERDELEAVLAHELSHIRHKDVRLLVIAVIFAGIISFAAEMMFRNLMWGGLRAGGRGRSGSRNGGMLILLAVALIVVAYLLSIMIRFALSRRREYMADAGAIELTRNPDAMISALEKISGRAEMQKAPAEVREMMLENPKTGFMGVFATHPPIEKRIAALVEHAGGRRRVRRSAVPEV
ncbi:M48 family metallopeptidase [Maricaulis sp. CAU 1757]